MTAKERHYLQWHVLSQLQTCKSHEDYFKRRCELYEWAAGFRDRAVGYYVVFLLEECCKPKAMKSLVHFTDKVERCPTLAPPKKRPDSLTALFVPLRVIPPLEDFKI